MKLIIMKPNTPSKRHYLNIFCELSKNPVLKTKLLKKINCSGRNHFGKITIKHKGHGHKRLYRVISFNNQNSIGITFSIEYDPFRTANIALIYNFEKKKFFYIIAPKYLKPGHIIKTGKNAEQKIGNSMNLSKISIGCPIFNVSIKFNEIGKISRAAGTYSLLTNKNKMVCELILSSGVKVCLFNNSFCTIGIVSNEFSFLKKLGKAGRSRWLNIRPSVRAISMNSVDCVNKNNKGKNSLKTKKLWGKKKYNKSYYF